MPYAKNCKNCQHAISDHAEDGACLFNPGTFHPHIIFCQGCRMPAVMSARALAQLALGEEMVYACVHCNNKIELQPEYLSGRAEDREWYGHTSSQRR